MTSACYRGGKLRYRLTGPRLAQGPERAGRARAAPDIGTRHRHCACTRRHDRVAIPGTFAHHVQLPVGGVQF